MLRSSIAFVLLSSACVGPGLGADGGSSDTGTSGGPVCPVGAATCPCTAGGSCDPGLECVAGFCISLECVIGAQDCPCTPGGGCDPGLECMGGFCGPGTPATTGSMTTSPTSNVDDSTSMTPTTTEPDPDSSSSGGGSSTGEPAMLDAWTKRRPILVTNEVDVDLDDHEVLVDFDWDEDVDPLLADLRFTDDTGTVLLPYWIEQYTAPITARVWVRVPHVPASDEATIYIWYGNADAEDASDASATFHFYEGFDGDDVGPGWLTTGTYSVANGRLLIEDGSVYSTLPLLTLPGTLMEARINLLTSGALYGASMQYHDSQGWVVDSYEGCAVTNASWSCSDDMGIGIAGGSFGWASEWMGMGVGPNGFRFNGDHNALNQYDPDSHTGDFYLILGHPFGSEAGNNDCDDIEFHHLFMRNFVEIEPSIAFGAEEDV